jgi:hypothetical protein
MPAARAGVKDGRKAGARQAAGKRNANRLVSRFAAATMRPGRGGVMTAELHCHSLFSVDGWATPGELIERAAAAGVGTFSLTDHNTLDGLEQGRARAGELGLDFITGLELDVAWRGDGRHMLAFGFDPANGRLAALCRRQFAQYEANFARFMPVLQRRYGVTEEQLRAGLAARYRGHPAPVLNKWFARGFLLERGIFADAASARRAMSDVAAEAERDVPEPWTWAGLDEVLAAVHDAGGLLLLAHPAGGLRGNLAAQRELIHAALAAGLDGFELYHPSSMAEPHFAELVAEARRLGCAVSGGSDTHADPHDRSDPMGFAVPDWVAGTLTRRGHGPCGAG